MRISGGVARGIPLQVPKADAVRPATDGMRQRGFSSLGERVVGARFLDLFAGSGAYGLEALSRGAEGGVWVEQHRQTKALLERNVDAVCRSMGRRIRAGLKVMQGDALTAAWPTELGLPDLVFVDPPYPIIEEVAPKVFGRLQTMLAEIEDVIVVFELPGGMDLQPSGWECVKRIGKGLRQPTVAFFRRDRGRH
ncbi:MAG: RsmD family RNA methyltransferase [Candidatus Synoicihabitans palmerolidicus]|nr:RsmD family RNA methyltransferase [Candidatus Synoicihabitans palmerolidicus]